jgi:hypothetical protein
MSVGGMPLGAQFMGQRWTPTMQAEPQPKRTRRRA